MLPPGYTARRLVFDEASGLPDGPDVDRAHAVVSAAEIAVLGYPDGTREAQRAHLTSHDAVRDEHRLVLDPAGEPVALLAVERDEGLRTVFVEVSVVPGHADRLFDPLLTLGCAAADRVRGAGDWRVVTSAFAQDSAAISRITDAGFGLLRCFWRMRVDLTGVSCDEPEPPSGVTRTVATTAEERRLLHRIDQESFIDHFEFAPEPFDVWMPWFTDRRDARPDLWWLAWLDGEPVGLCIGDDRRADVGEGYVRVLGVIPSARGRGIATWLLRTAFAQAAREGRTAVRLNVDSENTTGAVGLYERVGMRVAEARNAYAQPL